MKENASKARQISLILKRSTYPILVGSDCLGILLNFAKNRRSNKIVLLSDQSLKKARAKVRSLFPKSQFEFTEIPLQAGEKLKDIEAIYPVYAKLLKAKADRDTLFIALGGGSVGDAIGFVASTYLRGVDWVGLPTTLLAQVDSSVGGKTGINHREGKNLIGSFHQPSLVICDTDFLHTLGAREITSGLGEAIKYGITYDPKLFATMEKNLEALKRLDAKSLPATIVKALEYKVKAVEADEFDRKGVREVLNFGHTFAHALESLTNYRKFQHGEAVIWGMRFAIALSEVRGHLDTKSATQIAKVLSRFSLPPLPRVLKPDQYFETMKKDKKSSQNQVRFVLLKRLGETVSDAGVTRENLHQAFQLMAERERGLKDG